MKLLHTLPLVAVFAVGGCALFAPPPLAAGQTEAEVLAVMGRASTGRYPMPGGVTRLEFATGPYGRVTWMVDLGPDGRTRAFDQVLNTAHFADFAQRAPGMSIDELLRELGRPGDRTGGGWMGGQTWSWRYPTNDCLWFQVGITAEGKVKDAGYGNDPACEVGDLISLRKIR